MLATDEPQATSRLSVREHLGEGLTNGEHAEMIEDILELLEKPTKYARLRGNGPVVTARPPPQVTWSPPAIAVRGRGRLSRAPRGAAARYHESRCRRKMYFADHLQSRSW